MRQLHPACVTLAAIGFAESSAKAQISQCHWEELAGSSNHDFHRTLSLAAFEYNGSNHLFAGGTFRQSLGGPTNFLAMWDGQAWSRPGDGVGGPVLTLTTYDDGSGPALYAGGGFIRAGSQQAYGIAKWNGEQWSALASGMYNPGPFGSNGTVNAICGFDDGSGQALYAAGQFIEAGDVPALNIARWNGAEWSAVGVGLAHATTRGEVMALAVYDDGSAPALYAAGLIDGAVQRWNGHAWKVVGQGISGPPEVLCTYHDGTGSSLYAGGQIYYGNLQHIMRFDGSQWSAVGSGLNFRVRSMCIFDDGSGPALYVGGAFSMAGTLTTWAVARWDGQWSALGDGLYHAPWGPSADALSVFDDGKGPALYAGGEFIVAGEVPVESIARWKCVTCYSDCDNSANLDIFDFLCFQDAFIQADPYADCDGSNTFDIFDFVCFQDAFAQGCF